MATIRYNNFDGQLNVGVSDFLLQNNEITAAKNCYCYIIGKLEKTPGYSKAGTTYVTDGREVTYLHNHLTSAGNNYLFAFSKPTSGSNPVLKYIAPDVTSPVTTWTAITLNAALNGYSAAQYSAVSFLNKVFIVGYVSDTSFLPVSVIKTDLTHAVSDGTDLTNMPTGKYIVRYNDLLYVLNANTSAVNYPSRAYYSSDITAGAITWTPATNFETFGYDDGQVITGGATSNGVLVVFKNKSMYKYDESSVVKIDDVGCDSHNSILNINNILYWANKDGIWRWNGGSVMLISEKVKPFIDAITQSTFTTTVKAVQYGHEYRLFIGNVTVNNITYNNCWICFDTKKEKFYIRCTYYNSTASSSHNVCSACNYIESGKVRAYFGTSHGYVERFATKVDAVYSDDGQDIDSFFVTKNFDYGNPEDVNLTTAVRIFSQNSQGMNMTADADNKNTFDACETLQLNGKGVIPGTPSISANRVRYKFSEKGQGKSWEFEGLSVEANIKEVTK